MGLSCGHIAILGVERELTYPNHRWCYFMGVGQELLAGVGVRTRQKRKKEDERRQTYYPEMV